MTGLLESSALLIFGRPRGAGFLASECVGLTRAYVIAVAGVGVDVTSPAQPEATVEIDFP